MATVTIKECDICADQEAVLHAHEAPKQTEDGRLFQHYGQYFTSYPEICGACEADLQEWYAKWPAWMTRDRAMMTRRDELRDECRAAVEPIEKEYARRIDVLYHSCPRPRMETS